MQLDDVSPEHDGSFLQLSMSNDEFIVAATWLNAINLVAITPTTTLDKSPRKNITIDNHSVKRRRSEAGRHTANFDSTKFYNMKTK